MLWEVHLVLVIEPISDRSDIWSLAFCLWGNVCPLPRAASPRPPGLPKRVFMALTPVWVCAILIL